jgi:hypothetical protein
VQLRPRRKLDRVKRFVRELALVRYARGNLKLTLGNLVRYKDEERPQCSFESVSDADRALLEGYLRALPRELGIPASRIILVFDSDRHAIYDGESGKIGDGCVSRDEAARLLMLQRAPAHGLHVVTTGILFEQFYRSTKQQVDYLPEDGHWNANGHRLVAQRVAAIINREAAATSVNNHGRPLAAGSFARRHLHSQGAGRTRGL